MWLIHISLSLLFLSLQILLFFKSFLNFKYWPYLTFGEKKTFIYQYRMEIIILSLLLFILISISLARKNNHQIAVGFYGQNFPNKKAWERCQEGKGEKSLHPTHEMYVRYLIRPKRYAISRVKRNFTDWLHPLVLLTCIITHATHCKGLPDLMRMGTSQNSL